MFRSVFALLPRRVRTGALVVLLPGLGRSDVITLTSDFGPNFSFIGQPPCAGQPTANAMCYWAMDFNDSVLTSSNPLAPVVSTIGSDSFIGLQTGPLAASTDSSWAFARGSLQTGGTGLIPIPTGYPTCAAAGFSSFSPDLCALSAAINGSLGVTTFALTTPPVLYGSGPDALTLQDFDLTATLSFDINPGLALAEGISTGPYFGFFNAEGEYFTLPSTPGFLNQPGGIRTTSYELVGSTVPEPSTFALLAAVLCGFMLIVKRRVRTAALFALVVLLPGLCRSDTITPISGLSDYLFLSGNQNGIRFSNASDSNAYYESSNPLAPIVKNEDDNVMVQTGPLVASTDSSWTFEGGTLTNTSGLNGSLMPLPLGYSTCEAAGFVTVNGLCKLNPTVTGILGLTTFSLGDVFTGWQGFTWEIYNLAASVAFDISPDLAQAESVSAGIYFGTFTTQGWYCVAGCAFNGPFLVNPPILGFEAPLMSLLSGPTFELKSTTIPEPSSLILLLTAVAGSAISLRRKARR